MHKHVGSGGVFSSNHLSAVTCLESVCLSVHYFAEMMSLLSVICSACVLLLLSDLCAESNLIIVDGYAQMSLLESHPPTPLTRKHTHSA